MHHTTHLKRSLLILILLLVFIYLLAIMPRLSKSSEMTSFTHYTYAHRGLYNNDTHIPENSLPAFSTAIAAGYGIELDVQLTKDLIPIVLHDTDLLRSCNVNKKVSELTYDELQTYTLFGSEETIPKFDDVLTLINGQVPLLIELKVELDYKSTCEITSQLLDRYHGLYTIQSFSPYALKWFKENKPDVIRGQLSQNYFKGASSGYNVFTDFVLSHFLLNFLTKPDYLAYNYEHEGELSLTLCHTLFKTSTMGWTVASEEDYLAYKNKFSTIIFEHFLPPIS